jgi:ABC-type sugar transport system permease subunit
MATTARPRRARPGLASFGLGSLRRQEAFWGLVFMAPVVLATLAFDILPVLPSLYWSFTDWQFLKEPRWVGLENYGAIFQGTLAAEARRAAGWTVLYALGSTVCVTVVGLGLALLVDRTVRWVGVFRAVYYLPVVTSTVAAAFAWQFVFHQRSGVINWTLRALDMAPVPWFSEELAFLIALLTVTTWHGMGFTMVLFLAGLQAIPVELREAAATDGANARQVFFRITLPLLTPTIFLVMIISLINYVQAFDLVFIFGQRIEVYVYRLWFYAFVQLRDGLASAMAVLLFVVLAAVTYVQWRLQDKWVHYG